MKKVSARHCFSVILSLTIASTIAVGCGKKPSQDAAFNPSGKATATSVTPNNFKEVANHLDPGGDFYLFMGTKQWTENLSAKVADLRQLLTSLPNVPSSDRANLDRLFEVVTALVKCSGLEDVSAVGASGVQVGPGMYLNKFMAYHAAGKKEGLLWSLFGKEPHALAGLDYLPDTTALATFTDLDAAQLWTTLKEQVDKAGIPELSRGLEEFTKGMERGTGIKLDKLLESLGGEIGFILTLDNSKTITLPMPNAGKLEMPEPALALMIKVKDDTIFNRFDQVMQMNRQLVKTDKDGLKMRSMPVPAPFPLRPTVARSGDYLFLATSDKLVNELVATKEGSGKSLKRNDEFKRISKGIPLEGNSFTYLSPEVGRTFSHILETVAFAQSQSGRSDQGAELLQKLMGDGRETFAFSVASNTKEGWFVQGNSSQHPAASLLGPTMIAPAAVAAGVTLPALARAKGRAQDINCINNLKQIGLAARIYANDHGDVMPKDFLEMKDELNTPRILVCPNDNRPRAMNWSDFSAANVSYEIVSPGVRADDPQKVYVRCKVHGHTCLVDGSVQASGGARGARTGRR